MAWTAPRTWTDGELVTKAIMDPHIRDNFLAVGPHLIVRKSSDQSVTSSTVLVNDTALLFPVAGTEVWRFGFDLLFTGAAAGDLKVAFTFTAGGTFSAGGMLSGATGTIYDIALATTTSPTGNLDIGCNGVAVSQYATIQGVYVNGGTGGNVTMQFAQNTSNATATIVKTNSTLWAVKLA